MSQTVILRYLVGAAAVATYVLFGLAITRADDQTRMQAQQHASDQAMIHSNSQSNAQITPIIRSK